MRCPNPRCDWDDKEFKEHFKTDEPLFRYFFRDGGFWLECVQCGTEFRPSKTLNGLEVHR